MPKERPIRSPSSEEALLNDAIDLKVRQTRRDPHNQGGVQIQGVLENLSGSEPGDVQRIAASQIELLTSYYNTILAQARTSFNWAVGSSITGWAFFLASIAFVLARQSESIAILGTIAGTIVQVIAGVQFYLYSKTTNQLVNFHQKLDLTQRYLLANSLCEALGLEYKDRIRSRLILEIMKSQTKTSSEEGTQPSSQTNANT